MACLLKAKFVDNFLSGNLVRSCCEGYTGDLWKHICQDGKLQIFGPEIMSPLGYTVGFVDGEEAYL